MAMRTEGRARSWLRALGRRSRDVVACGKWLGDSARAAMGPTSTPGSIDQSLSALVILSPAYSPSKQGGAIASLSKTFA